MWYAIGAGISGFVVFIGIIFGVVKLWMKQKHEMKLLKELKLLSKDTKFEYESDKIHFNNKKEDLLDELKLKERLNQNQSDTDEEGNEKITSSNGKFLKYDKKDVDNENI